MADLIWHKVAELDELPEGRVKSATAGTTSIALVHFEGQYAAMENHCPHQGGPLGEGSIEKGIDGQCWLRCPWHGWDFHPLTGKSPGGHEDTGQQTYPVEAREDGIYVGVEDDSAHEATISDLMVDTLTNWGLDSVFGMVGHSNLGVADALRLAEEDGRITYFGIRHEGAASFAASGYAKLTGRPAACLSIAGPGATNMMTGLWDAKVDRAPILALTGQVQEQVIGVHAFQDIDLEAAFQAVAVFSESVRVNSDHAGLASLAMKTALVQTDVSHLVFPDNVQTLPAPERAKAGGPAGRLGSQNLSPDPDSIDEARTLIAEAKRPMIIVGYGALDCMDAVIALAEELGCPVVTTFKAKGQISDAHPLSGGVLGRSGTPIASWFMNEADLLIVFGASFSDHTGIYPTAKTIQVDRDPMRLAKRHPVTCPVLGDLGIAAKRFIGASQSAMDQRSEIAERWRIWREEKASRMGEDRGKGLSAALVFDALTRHAPEDAIIVADVGNNTYSFGRYFEASGRQRVLMSGYLGSIGFALPAAMGAYAATLKDPRFAGRKVISISGDGGLGQYAMELTTLVKYGMNICHVLLNNGELGKITKEQRAGEWPVWQTSLKNPSFAEFATLCGAAGYHVANAGDLDSALTAALTSEGPALVEIMTDAELV